MLHSERSTSRVSFSFLMSLASPSRIQRSREGWKAIELVVDYTHAVGRIGNRGSCILISLPVPANTVNNGSTVNQAVLLTTSFVLQNREEAKDQSAVFLEQPVTGAGAKGSVDPITVKLRGDVVFLCSARAPPKRLIDYVIDDQAHSRNITVEEGEDDEEPQREVEELGYTVVLCDLVDQNNVKRDLRQITPLPLPVVLETIPKVEVGDTHLLVTHENSKNRRYVIVQVTEVYEHHCTYAFVDPTCQFSSGGSVFTATGEFIGIQHQCGDSSYCIFVRDIVSHLFDSGNLGLCKIPVLSADSEDARDEEGELNPNAQIKDEEFNEPFNVTQRSKLMDVGAGDQIVSFEELEIVRRRKESGRSKGETVKIRRHTEVWNYWTQACGPPGLPAYYRGLILLLAAFPYQVKLCTKILSELTSHENRHHIASVSSFGGVGIILEVLDSHPHDAVLVQTAITSLARVSLYDANKESIARSDGIPVILAVMREFIMSYDIQQWAFYMLLNLLLDGEDAAACAHSVMRYAGLEIILQSLERHATGPHLQRWGWQTVGLLLRRTCASDAAFLIVRGLGGISLLVRRLEEFWKNAFVCFGAAYALHCLLRVDDAQPQTTKRIANDVASHLLELAMPLHVHPAPQHDDEDDADALDVAALQAFQQAEHAKKGCAAARNFASLLFELMHQHSVVVSSDSAPLMEYLMIVYMELQNARQGENVAEIETRDFQEDVVVRATQAYMTEARMHMIAERVLRNLGVSDPFSKYSHLQRDRNPNVHKEL